MKSFSVYDRQYLSKLLLIWALMLVSVNTFGADGCPHKQNGAASPQDTIPLKQALGEEAFEKAMKSGKYRYVGNAKCRLCHREFFVGRKQDAHDFAMDLLVKAGQEKNDKCLVCHTTGHGIKSGFVSTETTPRLSNVQCEGCHGPGNIHIMHGMKKEKGGFLAGTDRPEILKKMCKSCHTERWEDDDEKFEIEYKSYRSAKPQCLEK